jgi:hypothetical protein
MANAVVSADEVNALVYRYLQESGERERMRYMLLRGLAAPPPV